VCSTLFGSTSILTLSPAEVWLCVGMSVLVMAVFILFYNKIFAVTFDESFARATGTKAGLCNLLIAVVVAVIIVLAMNLVGFPADLCTGDLPGTVRHADVQELSQRERRRKLPVLLLN
jgi:PREDICTED: chelated iron transport system membrane protein yfeD-like, partial